VPAFDAVELVGYVASALVVLSLAMTSVVRLRWISLAGSVTFTVYGVLIGSVPIVLTNAAIAVINVWYLRRELSASIDLGVSLVDPRGVFLADFLRFHSDDIRRFQPDFPPPGPDDLAFLLYRDGLPAGVLIGRRDGEQLDVTLDYVLEEYRDSRLGRWLFGKGASAFTDAGIRRLVSRSGTELHRAYLERMGFRPRDGRFQLDL
jgi:hypothetical protein